jgi:hypothetical protein
MGSRGRGAAVARAAMIPELLVVIGVVCLVVGIMLMIEGR